MSMTTLWQDWTQIAAQRRFSFYAWRDGLSASGRIALALAAAAFIGLCAQVAVPLPFTPVPLTLQNFAVATVAVTLGWGWGALAAVLYVGLAALGMPWLVGAKGGWMALAGPTGGYLFGYMLMAAALGRFAQNPARCRWLPMWAALFSIDALLVLVPGALWLRMWFAMTGHPIAFTDALNKGLFPFMAGDLLKSGLTASIAGWLGRR